MLIVFQSKLLQTSVPSIRLLDVTQTGAFPQCFHVKTEAVVGVYSWRRVVLVSFVGF